MAANKEQLEDNDQILYEKKGMIELTEINVSRYQPANPFPEEDDEDSDGVEVGIEEDKKLLANPALTASDKTYNKTQQDEEKKDRDGIYTDYEEVLHIVGFGKAQIFILLGAGLVLASDSVEVLGIGYVLQYLHLESEFGISLRQVALLSANTFIGMLIGSYLWGGLADISGRRTVLLMSLFVNSFFAFLSAFSPNYYFLLIARFLSGIGVGGSLPVFSPYVSEFSGSKYRGSYLNFLSTSWITGAVLTSALAWAWLPHQEIGLSIVGMPIHSWRVFLFLCAVPSFVGGILCIIMPEGPRYLLEVGQEQRAIRILRNMYYINNLMKCIRGVATFPVQSIKLHLSVESDSKSSIKYILCNCNRNLLEILRRTSRLYRRGLARSTILLMITYFCLSFGSYGVTLWFPSYVHQLASGVTTPFSEACNETLSGVMLKDDHFSASGHSFLCSCPLTNYSNVAFDYRSVRKWWAWQSSIEDLVIRNGDYDWVWLDEVTWDNIVLSNVSINSLILVNSSWTNVKLDNVSIKNSYVCGTVISKVSVHNGSSKILNGTSCRDSYLLTGALPNCGGEGLMMVAPDYNREYFHDLIITSSGYIGNLVSVIAIYFFVRSFWLAFSFGIATFSVSLLYFIRTEIGAVIVLCVYKAIIVPVWSGSSVVVADIFPTALRSTASGVFLLLARIGAIMGTYIFGLFTSTSHVAIPVLLTAAILLSSAVLSLFLPRTTRKTALK